VTQSFPKTSLVKWDDAYRIISSRFPPIDLFERIAPPSEWEALCELEMRTNERARQSWGEINLVPVEKRVGGPGASYVMAPFVYPRASRFSDGAYGLYYAGREFQTALMETIHHAQAFFLDTPGLYPRSEDYRVLKGRVTAELHDLRGPTSAHCLEPANYDAPQALARELRAENSNGVVYPSVRNPGGECVGAFWPNVVDIPIQTTHLRYYFDGRGITRYFDYGPGEWYEIANAA